MNYTYNDLSKQENIVTNTKYLLIPSSLTGFHNTETTIRKSVSKRVGTIFLVCHKTLKPP